jgi:hypothetical protein
VLGLYRSRPRHREQKARIDAFVACLDAFAAEHAGLRPFTRDVRPSAISNNVDDAGDDVPWRRLRNPGRLYARARLDAFAATRAGVEHFPDARLQRGFEGDVVRLHCSALRPVRATRHRTQA